MRLGKTVLKSIKSVIDGLGYPNNLWVMPSGSVTPYVTYFIVSSSTEYTFGGIREDIKIQLSVWDNNNNATRAIDVLSAIEGAFEFYSVTDGNYEIVCTHKTNEHGPINQGNNTDNYKQWIIELTFMCSRNRGT